MEKLLYRRQFILGPKEEFHGFPSWEKLDVAGTHWLCAHPELPVHQRIREGKSVTLLGYILDPDHPEHTDEDILDELARSLETARGFMAGKSRYGGRWILIADDGDRTVLFHDAAGLRQLCYAHSPVSGKTWCASQPTPIAKSLQLGVDPEASKYIAAGEAADPESSRKVYWFPGDTTMYREITVLLPNHGLDLEVGECFRYWPDGMPGRLSLKKGMEESVRLLKGLVKSASLRYPLSLSLTAGWDSRLMLVLCRDMIGEVYCFTLAFPGVQPSDIAIPSKLCKKLGVKHHIIHSPETADPEFRDIYRKNSPSIANAYSTRFQAIHEDCPPNRLWITGDVAEVAKRYYRLPGDGREMPRSQELAALAWMGDQPFVVTAFEKWLSSISDCSGIHPLDLFAWEQIAGRLQALNQLEYDIALESFSPYNCRLLLETMLAVAERHRRSPFFAMHRRIIGRLWKKCLSVPINPPDTTSAREALLDFLARTNLYRLVPETALRRLKRAVTNP